MSLGIFQRRPMVVLGGQGNLLTPSGPLSASLEIFSSPHRRSLNRFYAKRWRSHIWKHFSFASNDVNRDRHLWTIAREEEWERASANLPKISLASLFSFLHSWMKRSLKLFFVAVFSSFSDFKVTCYFCTKFISCIDFFLSLVLFRETKTKY